MGIAPIPFTAIHDYFKVYSVGSFEEFHYFIRVMDREYLSNVSKKQASKPKTKGGK